MEYRLATGADRPALQTLWQRVFGDEPAFIDESLDVFAGVGQVYVAADAESGIAAQLLAVPCTAGGHSGIYLYALATDAANRRGGVMTDLMNYSETKEVQKGAAFAVLIPANEPLFGYYEKRGYVVPLGLRRVCLPAPAAKAENVAFGPPGAEAFLQLRGRFAHGAAIAFSQERTALLLADLAASGVRFAQSGAGYVVYLTNGETLCAAELFAGTDEDATMLLGAVAAKEGCTRLCATLDGTGTLFAGQGDVLPYALLKPLVPGQNFGNLYLRFGFDEIECAPTS